MMGEWCFEKNIFSSAEIEAKRGCRRRRLLANSFGFSLSLSYSLSRSLFLLSFFSHPIMKLPRGHTPRVTADGKVEVHRHDEEKLARGGFGERMLRSLGWRDGDGLGVGRQGRAEAVRVTQKLDNKGVRQREEVAAGRVAKVGRRKSMPPHRLDRKNSTTKAQPFFFFNPPKNFNKKHHLPGRRQQGDRPRDRLGRRMVGARFRPGGQEAQGRRREQQWERQLERQRQRRRLFRRRFVLFFFRFLRLQR